MEQHDTWRMHEILMPRTNIFKSMKNKPESADSSLSEVMAARIEINHRGDPAHQKKITDAVESLDGVIETKIVKGALHVSYDPFATAEKKIEQAIRSTGTTIRAAATDTEGAHPDLPTPNVQPATAQKADEGEHS
jgi:copper chaperone CopZ